MATFTIRPNGTGTVPASGWLDTGGGATSLHDDIDDYLAGGSKDDDTSYARGPNNADNHFFVLLEDTPVGFDPATITEIRVKSAHRKESAGVSGSADTVTLLYQVFRSNETTAITNELSLGSITDASYVESTTAMTGTGTHAKTDWDGARLRIRQDYTIAGCADTTTRLRVTAVEIQVDYDASQTVGVSGRTSASSYGAVTAVTTNAPDAPTLVAPADAGLIDPADLNTFDWTFSDPDSGDAQSAWALRRIVAGASPTTAHPDEDIENGGVSWVTWDTAPTASEPLFEAVNSQPADTGDFTKQHLYKEVFAESARCVLGLAPLTDPGVSSGHFVRLWFVNPGDGDWLLLNGGDDSVVATRGIPVSVFGYGFWDSTTWELTSGEADAILDYGDLKVEFVLSEEGAQTEEIAVGFFELEIPGAAPEWWDATAEEWVATETWNTGSTDSYEFPANAWSPDGGYDWTVATKDSSGRAGPYATPFTVTAETAGATQVAGRTSQSTYGTVTVSPGPVSVTVAGKTSTSTYGTVAGAPGPVAASVAGRESSSSYGTVTTLAGNLDAPVTGRTSAGSYGAVTAAPGPVSTTAAGHTSGSFYGAISTEDAQTQPVTGRTSQSSYGSVAPIEGNANVPVAGHTSTSAYEAITPLPGNTTIPAAGHESDSTYGAVTPVPGGVSAALGGRTSASTYGTITTVAGATTIPVAGRASPSTYGAVTIVGGDPPDPPDDLLRDFQPRLSH